MLEGKKTLLAALAVMVTGLLEQVDPGTIANMVPAEYSGIALAAVGLVFAVLRFVTKTPVTKV
jgi:hypothetical protein